MKKPLILLMIFLGFYSGKLPLGLALNAAQYDYQNFNHGYAPECDTCGCSPCSCPGGPKPACDQPPAPCNAPQPACNKPEGPCNVPKEPCDLERGRICGFSACALGVVLIAIITAGVIIISSGNGRAKRS